METLNGIAFNRDSQRSVLWYNHCQTRSALKLENHIVPLTLIVHAPVLSLTLTCHGHPSRDGVPISRAAFRCPPISRIADRAASN